MDNIDTRVLGLLIELGKLGNTSEEAALPLLASLQPYDEVNRLYHATWFAACEPLSFEDHEALVKGLVLAEDALRWCGGSVAGAIWVFQAFSLKSPEKAEALAAWCLERSRNEYLPYGGTRRRVRKRGD